MPKEEKGNYTPTSPTTFTCDDQYAPRRDGHFLFISGIPLLDFSNLCFKSLPGSSGNRTPQPAFVLPDWLSVRLSYTGAAGGGSSSDYPVECLFPGCLSSCLGAAQINHHPSYLALLRGNFPREIEKPAVLLRKK